MFCGSEVGIHKPCCRSCFQGKASPYTDKGPGGVGDTRESMHRSQERVGVTRGHFSIWKMGTVLLICKLL